MATCIGMAISVYAFGTGGKRKKIFQDIYFSVEDTDGIGVLYTKTGEYSAILKMENPVQKPTPVCIPHLWHTLYMIRYTAGW